MSALATHINDLLARHKKVALQFSGGKDSLVMLHLLSPWLSDVSVYWLNSGDPYPETLHSVAYARTLAPDLIEIEGDVHAKIQQYGIPSDVVPVSATPIGVVSSGEGFLIQDRYSCCARTIMLPLHQRMRDDGITAIIRGQKQCDKHKSPAKNGDVTDGFELCFPLEDWTDDDIHQYLKEWNIPVPAYYSVLKGGPDCMCCSAWWEEGRSRWLRNYPDKFETYQGRLAMIQVAVQPHLAAFNSEVE